ncbi:hypothetical protein C9F11_02985 [Streptomyces sp. YIM 121038]|nr:hypothetical protein C9F11_02985 [Streptomyces sp. YIM 121038]
MGKWAAVAAGLAVAVPLAVATFRARRKRNRLDTKIDQAELNRWFRRHR